MFTMTTAPACYLPTTATALLSRRTSRHRARTHHVHRVTAAPLLYARDTYLPATPHPAHTPAHPLPNRHPLLPRVVVPSARTTPTACPPRYRTAHFPHFHSVFTAHTPVTPLVTLPRWTVTYRITPLPPDAPTRHFTWDVCTLPFLPLLPGWSRWVYSFLPVGYGLVHYLVTVSPTNNTTLPRCVRSTTPHLPLTFYPFTWFYPHWVGRTTHTTRCVHATTRLHCAACTYHTYTVSHYYCGTDSLPPRALLCLHHLPTAHTATRVAFGYLPPPPATDVLHHLPARHYLRFRVHRWTFPHRTSCPPLPTVPLVVTPHAYTPLHHYLPFV